MKTLRKASLRSYFTGYCKKDCVSFYKKIFKLPVFTKNFSFLLTSLLLPKLALKAHSKV